MSWELVKNILAVIGGVGTVSGIVFAVIKAIESKKESRVILIFSLRKEKNKNRFNLVLKNNGKSPLEPINGWLRFIYDSPTATQIVFEEKIKKSALESQETQILTTPTISAPEAITKQSILFCLVAFKVKDKFNSKIFFTHLADGCMHETDQTYYGINNQRHEGILALHLEQVKEKCE